MKNLLVKILFVVVGLVIGFCSQSEIEEQVLKPSVVFRISKQPKITRNIQA